MIIGINGFKGSGKDTIGAYMESEWGFIRKSFAAKLKDSAAALFGIDPKEWESWKNESDMEVLIMRNRSAEIGRARLKGETTPIEIPHVRLTVREFLQRYGTEAHRDIFGKNFWVDHGLKGVDPNKGYVFTDARFENELEAIKKSGGYNLRVVRGEDISDDNHASEVAPPPHLIDYQIENNGTFEDLYREVDNFIEFIKLEIYATY